tara:strand:+ start:200 stop:1471 length:1272 start_codon:yes stop_codon:yes gene_type:complete
MKVIHLAYSDYIGGASIAAKRIHLSLLNKNIESELWVDESCKKIPNSFELNNKLEKIFKKIRIFSILPLLKLVKTDVPIHHSISVLGSKWPDKINNSDADIVNLHWVQRETVSIKDISKIKKPIIWTLHDMWAFCGAEHYTKNDRWEKGYKLNNRPSYESGFDINRWTWQRKKKYWKKQFQIVTPSNWLSYCVSKSALMQDWPVSVIPNPIDKDFWKPINKYIAKKKMNLPTGVPLILFGADGGSKDLRKGYNLLLSALNNLKNVNESTKIELVVFGQKRPLFFTDYKFPIHFVGHLEDKKLRDVYNAVDVMVIPSKQDNLPNTAVEAQICGIPVVSFDIGGLADIIDHKKTGYLARPFDTYDFADGISWVLKNNKENQLSSQSRKQAIKNFNKDKIADSYINIYKKKIKQELQYKTNNQKGR